MSDGYLVLDIETVPDPTLYVHPEVPAAVERPFPPLYVHMPIVVGVLWLNDDYCLRRLGVIGEGKDERATLESLSSFVGRYRPCLVTYNGRNFDLPVLALRSLRAGVPIPWYYEGRLRHRYSEEGHIDLCDVLADHGATRAMSLDSLARLIGLPGKVGVDGSQVEGMFKAGQLEQIRAYCLSDVAQTTLLLLRLRLIQGVLPVEDYRRLTKALVEALRLDPRLAPLCGGIDAARLLLTEP